MEKSDTTVIEKDTRNQNTSKRWHEERKKGLTASHIGKIVKVRSGNGVTEIKYPYSAKHLTPCEEVNLIYLNNNGTLKRSRNIFYQMQGLMDITNKEWCNFLIYTQKGLKIEKNSRNTEYFKKQYQYFMILLLLL